MNVRSGRFRLLDSMRAIAFVSVLVAHTAYAAGFASNGSWLTPYFARLDVGVRIFFLISAFLLYRPFVIARVNPIRFSTSTEFDFDDVLGRMSKAAAKFNVERVRQEDVVRTGGGAAEDD